MKVTGEFRFTVAVSADPGTKTDREGERFATGATKVGNVVGPDITQSNITFVHFLVAFSVDDLVSAQHFRL